MERRSPRKLPVASVVIPTIAANLPGINLYRAIRPRSYPELMARIGSLTDPIDVKALLAPRSIAAQLGASSWSAWDG
jgi:hypothetical protein